MPREDTQFAKGNPGGPGRPKGSKGGRRKLLDMFDELLGEHLSKKDTLKRLASDIEKKFNANPVGFLMKVGFPLVPKEILMRHTGDEKAVLRIELMKPSEKGKGESDGDT